MQCPTGQLGVSCSRVVFLKGEHSCILLIYKVGVPLLTDLLKPRLFNKQPCRYSDLLFFRQNIELLPCPNQLLESGN